MRMRQWHVLAVAVALAAMSAPSGWAEVIDVTRNVASSGAITSVATLTVTPITISTGATAASLAFGTVTVGASPWVRAPQYLRLQYQSNQTSWAVRVLTNNRVAFPSMVGFVTVPGNLTDPNDDQLGYAGMIGTVPTNVTDRVSLAWQVYRDPIAGGPAAPAIDTDVNPVNPDDAWRTPWAFVADASDCLSNCRTGTPVTIDKTGEYFRIVQGGPLSSGLLAHPNDNNRIGDNDIAVYVSGRFGGAPADSYSTTVIVEMYHF